MGPSDLSPDTTANKFPWPILDKHLRAKHKRNLVLVFEKLAFEVRRLQTTPISQTRPP